MSKNHHNVQDVYINMFNGNMETKIKKKTYDYTV